MLWVSFATYILLTLIYLLPDTISALKQFLQLTVFHISSQVNRPYYTLMGGIRNDLKHSPNISMDFDALSGVTWTVDK